MNDFNEHIERLQGDVLKMKDNHSMELFRTNEQRQNEVSNLKRIVDKTNKLFPSFKRILNMDMSACNVASVKNRQSNCCMGGPSIIVGSFTQTSTGVTHLPTTSRHR